MRSRVIAIAGAKGSPGCSFLATALARYFASSNIATLLLDGDAEGGGLAALLDVGSALAAGAADGSAADQPAIQVEKQLWFAELGAAQSEQLVGLQLAGAARLHHQAVVIDLGHSAGPIQRQLSAASDWLLWVAVPDRSGLERADRGLAACVLGAARSGLVLNRIGRGCLERADEVLSSRHRIPVMARINEDRRVALQLSQGLPVHRDRALRSTLGDLARSVHPDVAPAARPWPPAARPWPPAARPWH